MSEPASPEDRRRRLDLLVDEASMLSFPASDPPAVFVEEPGPTREGIVADEGVPRRQPPREVDLAADHELAEPLQGSEIDLKDEWRSDLRLGREGEGGDMADFVTVARVGDIEQGALSSFDVGGTQVAIANVGGSLYAFGDTCTHRQCSLADGELDGTTVTCPCHGSQFDVTTGTVRNPPATEPVPSFAIRIDGEGVQVRVP